MQVLKYSANQEEQSLLDGSPIARHDVITKSVLDVINAGRGLRTNTRSMSPVRDTSLSSIAMERCFTSPSNRVTGSVFIHEATVQSGVLYVEETQVHHQMSRHQVATQMSCNVRWSRVFPP